MGKGGRESDKRIKKGRGNSNILLNQKYYFQSTICFVNGGFIFLPYSSSNYGIVSNITKTDELTGNVDMVLGCGKRILTGFVKICRAV